MTVRVEVRADVAAGGSAGRESPGWKRLMELMVVAQRRRWEREAAGIADCRLPIADSEGSRDAAS